MHRKWFAILSVLAIVSITALGRTPAYAVHDVSLFELDGNANASAAAGDDWSLHFPTASSSAVIAKSFGNEPPSNDSTYYKAGGSKDVNDVNQWQYAANPQAPD